MCDFSESTFCVYNWLCPGTARNVMVVFKEKRVVCEGQAIQRKPATHWKKVFDFDLQFGNVFCFIVSCENYKRIHDSWYIISFAITCFLYLFLFLEFIIISIDCIFFSSFPYGISVHHASQNISLPIKPSWIRRP